MSDVLVLGDAIVDFVFAGVERYPDPGEEVIAPTYELRPGGSAGYATMGLAALGLCPSVTAVVGDGVLSTHWLEFLETRGADTGDVRQVGSEPISAAVAFLHDSDRSFLTYRGASGAGRPVDPGAYDPADYDALLIAGFTQAPYLWTEATVELAERFDRAGIPVALDTNRSPGDWRPTFETLLPSVEYLVVNDEEARWLADESDLSAAGHALVDAGAGTCVVKAGERGCLLLRDGTRWVSTDPVDAVDDCGAGDFFNAGFLSARLDGRSLEVAAAFGNRCAREAITRFPVREKLSAIGSIRGD
jgi:sugar/nucleoside kinase (ribokinase family)